MGKKYNPIARLSEMELKPFSKGRRYESKHARVGEALQLTRLGCGYSVVPPGKTGCPFHVHHAEDEMFVILSGSGEYRFGKKKYKVRAGDVLGAPIGGADYAHQLWNTGDKPLKYLAISSKAEMEYCEYPDSGKVGFFGRKAGSKMGRFQHMARTEDGLDYFDGDQDV